MGIGANWMEFPPPSVWLAETVATSYPSQDTRGGLSAPWTQEWQDLEKS